MFHILFATLYRENMVYYSSGGHHAGLVSWDQEHCMARLNLLATGLSGVQERPDPALDDQRRRWPIDWLGSPDTPNRIQAVGETG
jgi:hypothetical protein